MTKAIQSCICISLGIHVFFYKGYAPVSVLILLPGGAGKKKNHNNQMMWIVTLVVRLAFVSICPL